MTIIYNTLLARFILKEPMHKSDYIAFSFMILGSTLFVCFAQNKEKKFTYDILVKLYTHPRSVMTFIAASIIFTVALFTDMSNRAKL